MYSLLKKYKIKYKLYLFYYKIIRYLKNICIQYIFNIYNISKKDLYLRYFKLVLN